MDINIRRMTINDANLLSTIGSKTFYDTFKNTCSKEDMDNFLYHYFNEKQTLLELQNDQDFFYLATVNGMPAGYVRFQEDYTHFEKMKEWKSLELKRIYILQDFLGKGVAQKLMDLVINYCKNNKYEALWLGVWEHNVRAQKFYAKYGFVNSGFTHNFPIGNTPQTDFWFWKFFN